MAYSKLPVSLRETILERRQQKKSHGRIPHLDGLRAVALAGVLLFHFKVPGFTGGFIGVDMFFTISGFLITRNILKELESHSFSLYKFYRRRFFRLYPASLVVILITLLTSFIFIKPLYQKIISQSAIASMTLWSNIFFHSQGEYFAQNFEMRPLLHFWSLSVEEQFYTFWPPLLMFVSSFRRPVLFQAVLWALAIASFIFTAKIYDHHATFAFYQLPSRIFQFAAGAILSVHLKHSGKLDKLCETTEIERLQNENVDLMAIHETSESFKPTTSYPKPPSPEINDFNDILSVVTTIIVICSFILLPPSPSPFLILPITIATCALIAIPHGVICEIFFCSSTFSLLGKLSYSIYLVHWPICVLADYIFNASGLKCPKVLLLLLSLWLGSKLHNNVEEPMRYVSSSMKKIVLVASIVFTMGFAVGGVFTDGYKFRFPEEGKTGWPKGMRERFFWDVCIDVSSHYKPENPHMKVCRVGDLNGTESNLYFFGDSFTGHLSVGLDVIGKRRGIYFDLRYVDYCGFRTLDHFKSQARALQGFPCSSAVEDLWAHTELLPNGSTIVVANWWGEPMHLSRTLTQLRQKVHESGKSLAVVAEPPGISAVHKGYYSCADIAVLPLGRMLSKAFGRSLRGGYHCLDSEAGFAPGQTFADEQLVFHRIFKNELNGSKLVNIFPHLCKRKIYGQRGRPTYRCRLPASVDNGMIHDIGYEPDLTHLTSVGSFNISDILDKELFE